MKLTVIVDNNTYIDKYYLGEPALCFYIDDVDARVLLDTGYSDVFIKNMRALDIELKDVTHIALSHGHNDHTGGLAYLAGTDTSSVELVAHPDCLMPKREDGLDIGSPILNKHAAERFRYMPSKCPRFITERLCFLGEIPRVTDFEAKEPIGEAFTGGEWQRDFLPDDTALAYRTDEGVFVITGCSHSGICNICLYAKRVMGCDRLAGVIGGFHLFDENAQLDKTAEFFRQEGVSSLYPCHCVSLAAKAALMRALPKGCVREVGVSMELCR